jgi:hypothetical protein
VDKKLQKWPWLTWIFGPTASKEEPTTVFIQRYGGRGLAEDRAAAPELHLQPESNFCQPAT